MGPGQDHRRRPRAAARPRVQRLTAVYDRIGVGYADLRRPDPRIAAALGAVVDGPVVNVGAGAGSYEPSSTVVAVEPSALMLSQRPPGTAPAVQAVAEALPFRDASFGTALAVLTTHHWTRPFDGLAEMQRVASRQVVLTWDHDLVRERFWFLRDYLPEAWSREEHLAHLRIVRSAWPTAAVVPVPVPWDCTDGFFAAYWRRPEAYLVPAVRAAISAFELLDEAIVDAAVSRLAEDLASGEWERRYGDLRALDALDCGYRLVVNESSD